MDRVLVVLFSFYLTHQLTNKNNLSNNKTAKESAYPTTELEISQKLFRATEA